jgi:LSD1 subclass zinc finger protein
MPGEHPVAACKSSWTSDPQAPEGLLFLTDARIIFEQRQEIARKKVLFITTQKELVQSKLWEAPVGSIDDVEIEDQKAFLQRKEMMTLRFNQRTREVPSDITLQLRGTTNEEWRTLLRKAKSGEIEGDRFGAPPPKEQLAAQVEAEVTQPAKELPTVCPSCNAPLPAIFRGMKQVRCDYCDAAINL